MGISYDSLQRQLTLQSANIMQQVKEDGVYIPRNISHTSCEPQFFAMDNLDWNNKTQQGWSFHATTVIIIQSPQSDPPQNIPKITRFLSIQVFLETGHYTTSLTDLRGDHSPPLHRLKTITESDESAAQLLLGWRIERLIYASSDVVGTATSLPGFSAFCEMLYEQKQAYLPLIPESPTDHNYGLAGGNDTFGENIEFHWQ